MAEDQLSLSRESQLHAQASTDSSLAMIVNQMEQTFTAGDLARAEQVLEHNMLALWFGLDTSRFGEILMTLLRADIETSPLLHRCSS